MLAAESDDGYLRHINTDNTARDMLSIVEASGREKIQYWGFSCVVQTSSVSLPNGLSDMGRFWGLLLLLCFL